MYEVLYLLEKLNMEVLPYPNYQETLAICVRFLPPEQPDFDDAVTEYNCNSQYYALCVTPFFHNLWSNVSIYQNRRKSNRTVSPTSQ